MNVQIIKSKQALDTCPIFNIENLLWGTRSIPPTSVRIGFVPEEGIFVSFLCEEANPLRTFTAWNSPVYKDSAVEAFFCFARDSDTYLNFEMNANGALLAMYGADRQNRHCFSNEIMSLFDCHASLSQQQWHVQFHIPLTVITGVYGYTTFQAGSIFTCNFYKIQENFKDPHYASFSPVDSDIPNFHIPESFAQAILIK